MVSTHIRESAATPGAALWFTSLVSAESSMPKLRAELSAVNAQRVEELVAATGNKNMRVLAWSFLDEGERRDRLAALLAAGTEAEAGTLADAPMAMEAHMEQRIDTPALIPALSAEARRDPAMPLRSTAVGHHARSMRRLTRRVWTTGAFGALIAAGSALRHPAPARADLASAGASGLPLVGRFEKLSGAASFIGDWTLYSTSGPSGVLTLRRDGDVELRSRAGKLVGSGAKPWTYVSPKQGDSLVLVSFSIDSEEEDDVLYFEGAVDAALGPGRKLEGAVRTGYGRRVADFSAVPLPAPEALDD